MMDSKHRIELLKIADDIEKSDGETDLADALRAALYDPAQAPIYQARQLSEERWDDVTEPMYLACAGSPQFYEVRIVYAASVSPQAARDAAQAAQPDLYFYGDHEHGFECPDDAAIVSGRKMGDRFTLNAAWYTDVQFEVTKVPDDESDDYEVREVNAAPVAPAAAAPMDEREEFEAWWFEREAFGLRSERLTTPDAAAWAAWQARALLATPQG